MNKVKKWLALLLGKRIFKTGLSVFITATICEFLNWPVLFAIIAAIVTIEPTVNASIQKGKIRLPAAAMGAGVAMIFDFALGQTPISYALAAFVTILLCHKFRWDDAIIVATLTAVNMIAITENDFLVSFLTRVGTTSVGIITSVAVNFFVLPPNFMGQITKAKTNLMSDTKSLVDKIISFQLDQKGNQEELENSLTSLQKRLDHTIKLIEYQKEEYRYHRFKNTEYKILKRIQTKLKLLDKINHHVYDMLYLTSEDRCMHTNDKDILMKAWSDISIYFDWEHKNTEKNFEIHQNISELFYLLHRQIDVEQTEDYMDKSSSIAYELLAIHSLICKRSFLKST
ncbi:FUSC family protein [Chengkuizengella marina]|uniref:Aromatic acid exporter family protein n=1 Tax=Chengkuizengella marina TaxID=2507566 RepID=A0A6N9PXN2_9BACL|nr:aromatic acid exporter family protein [Chengkuizengella marina]NBI27666.1 aromatic acid exporter family protein [Chengkuizengella marina]